MNTAIQNFNTIFTNEVLKELFPLERTNQFFEALFGDADEGAYDIEFGFKGNTQNTLNFEFSLKQRPGKCLACNLTHGLPKVFTRHPIINISGLVQDIGKLLDGQAACVDWQLGATQKINRQHHVIPLVIFLNS